MNKIQEYISLLVQLSVFFLILYAVAILQNNLNILLLENSPILIFIGLLFLYYLFKRIVEFFGLGLTDLDVVAMFLLILFWSFVDSFSLLLSNLYSIVGFYVIFELYYIRTTNRDYFVQKKEFCGCFSGRFKFQENRGNAERT